MMIPNRTILSLVLLTSALPAVGQQTERPPATPLIAHDPYFSVWSATDKLTDSPTTHWTGHPEPLTSLVRIDGKTFRIMGRDPGRIPAMEQTARHLSFTHTRYSFRAAGVQIDLTFFTPAFLDDLDVLSRPVTYLSWTAHAIDGGSHTVSVFLEAQSDVATSYPGQPVIFSRHQTASETVVSVGTKQQSILNRSGDDLRIDWGYFHIAVPNDTHAPPPLPPTPKLSSHKTDRYRSPTTWKHYHQDATLLVSQWQSRWATSAKLKLRDTSCSPIQKTLPSSSYKPTCAHIGSATKCQ